MIKLVVFDVDGTLYRQAPVRLRMAGDLLLHCLKERSFATFFLIKKYRTIRERLGHVEQALSAPADGMSFDDKVILEISEKSNISFERARALIHEWMNVRPLRYLLQARYKGVETLFAALGRKNIAVGVWSDYPARAKLKALGLEADYIACAQDADINALKPNPRGLEKLMAQAGAEPGETVMVGDRVSRDGMAAQLLGVPSFIIHASHARSGEVAKDLSGCRYFHTYSGLEHLLALDGNVA